MQTAKTCDSDMGTFPLEQPAHLELVPSAVWHRFYLISSPHCLKALWEALGLDIPPNYRWLCHFLGLSWQKEACPSFFNASGMLLFWISHCTYILKSEKVFEGALGMATRGKLWYFWPRWEEAVGGEAKGLQKREEGDRVPGLHWGTGIHLWHGMALPTRYPGIFSRLSPFLPFFACLCLRSWMTLFILQLRQQRKVPNIPS